MPLGDVAPRRLQVPGQEAEMNDEPDRPTGLLLIEAAIRSLRRQGVTTAAGLARALNDQGITTTKWTNDGMQC
jgi:hypothetical protein